jgi:hypothetical protein
VGNATGRNAKVTRNAAAPMAPSAADGRHQVVASEPGAVAAAGDVVGNATGDSSEVEER